MAVGYVRIFLGIFSEKKKKNEASWVETGISLRFSGMSNGYPSLRQARAIFLPFFHRYSWAYLYIREHPESFMDIYLSSQPAPFSMDNPRNILVNIPRSAWTLQALANTRIFLGISMEKKEKRRKLGQRGIFLSRHSEER